MNHLQSPKHSYPFIIRCNHNATAPAVSTFVCAASSPSRRCPQCTFRATAYRVPLLANVPRFAPPCSLTSLFLFFAYCRRGFIGGLRLLYRRSSVDQSFAFYSFALVHPQSFGSCTLYSPSSPVQSTSNSPFLQSAFSLFTFTTWR